MPPRADTPVASGLPAGANREGGSFTRVFVVGSANVDVLVTVESAPAPGETLLATSLGRSMGGKGANQAVAAARLGASVAFIGCVGGDKEGEQLVAALADDGIDTAQVRRHVDAPTGVALVHVLPDGANYITVAPGANALLDDAEVEHRLRTSAGPDDVVIVSAEIRAPAITAAVRTAHARRARPVLNLAPFRPLELGLLALCDPLIVNEAEASAITGRRITSTDEAREGAVDLSATARSAVITLGQAGAIVAQDGRAVHVPAPVVPAVDSTGAGDAFVGALAAELASGEQLLDAATIAVLAASASVRRHGAQPSYLGVQELAEFTASQRA